jgi:predicted small lipoprotein YifL
MTNTLKRFLCAVLTLATLISLAACATKAPAEEPSAAPEYIEHAFTQNKLPLDAAGATALVVEGGKLYFDTRDAATQGITLRSADLDGGNTAVLYELENTPYDPASPTFETNTLTGFTVDTSGNILLLTSRTEVFMADMSSVSETKLIKLAPDGTETAFDVPNGYDGMAFTNRAMCADADGNVYLAAGREILAFKPDGTYAFNLIITEGAFVAGIARAADGRAVYVSVSINGSYATQIVNVIDFAAQKATDNFSYKGTRYFTDIFPGDGDYDFYFSDYGELCGWSFASNSESIAIDLMGSDIDSGTIGAVAPVGDGSFIAAEKDASGAITGFLRLTPNPTATRSGKTIITLGTIYVDDFTKQAILDFNKKNTDARIEVRDYSIYNTQDDWTIGAVKLDLDVVNGVAPDIISYSYGAGGDPAKYAEKGAFADLYEFIDNDADFTREDFFRNILDAGTYNGELNILIPTFNLISIVGKKSIFGDKTTITVADTAAAMDKYPEASLFTGVQPVSAESTIAGIISANGLTNFNTPEFIELLEFGKRLPATAEFDWATFDAIAYLDAWGPGGYGFRENKALLASGGVDFASFRDSKDSFGEDFAYVGYPTLTGEVTSFISPYGMFAINAKSESKDVAWRFLRSLLTEENYLAIGNSSVTSINIHVFEAAAAIEMTPLAERDLSKGITRRVREGDYMTDKTYTSIDEIDMNDPYFANYALTAAEVAQMRAVIESTTKIPNPDNQINAIVREELEPYFAGAKTAEETAKVIQSRVSLYINEKK